MIVASILGGRVLAPLVQIVTQWRSVIAVRDSWGRLNKLLEAVPPKAKSMPLPSPKGRVQAENVVAGAPGGGAAILKGVAFALQPGETLAVVGPSASGKTTLARLLVGLWPSAGGKVRLDGADVYAWDKTELGPSVGYLPQDVELFDGTIAENIARFGDPDPHKVEAAARAVGLHEFILALPQGYDSPVGREGAMLSGGQRQRLGLARASMAIRCSWCWTSPIRAWTRPVMRPSPPRSWMRKALRHHLRGDDPSHQHPVGGRQDAGAASTARRRPSVRATKCWPP